MTPEQIAQLRSDLERLLQITKTYQLTDAQIDELEAIVKQSNELIVAAAKIDGVELTLGAAAKEHHGRNQEAGA